MPEQESPNRPAPTVRTPFSQADLLRFARKQTQLPLHHFAGVTGIPVGELKATLAGKRELSTAQLSLVARMLGLEFAEFLRGEKSQHATFFRHAQTDTLPAHSFLDQDDVLVIGDFIRAARRISRLRRLLNELDPGPGLLDDFKPKNLQRNVEAHLQGRELAERVRTHLGLGDEAIPSMRDLIERAGIVLLFPEPGRLQPRVEGVSFTGDVRAILINAHEDLQPWRRRATMAHELCHILFDRVSGRPLLVSLKSPQRQSNPSASQASQFAGHTEIEQRANAFAAHLLAPSSAVAARVGEDGVSPTSSAAAKLIARTFGVSYELAVNRLWDVFELTDDARKRLLHEPNTAFPPFAFKESPPGVGFFGQPLSGLVWRALEREMIDHVEAHRLLEIPLDQPLCDPADADAPEVARHPFFTRDEVRMRLAAHALVMLTNEPGLFVDQTDDHESGWVARIRRFEADGQISDAGCLHMGLDGRLRAAELTG